MSFDKLRSILDEEGVPSSVARVVDDRPYVVVVDDDEAVRSALGILFSNRYRVTLCASAEEGVGAVREDVCAVILDVKMEGRDGFWACEEIRKLHPDAPIIFYSAYQDVKDPFAIINEHRPFGYIMKDGSVERLIRAVDMASRLYRITLENKKLIRSLEQRRANGA